MGVTFGTSTSRGVFTPAHTLPTEEARASATISTWKYYAVCRPHLQALPQVRKPIMRAGRTAFK